MEADTSIVPAEDGHTPVVAGPEPLWLGNSSNEVQSWWGLRGCMRVLSCVGQQAGFPALLTFGVGWVLPTERMES